MPQTPGQGTAPTPQTNDNEEREREDMTPGKAKRLKEARALLEGFWPVVFSFRKPKPLKVGIAADLMADVETRGLPFTLEMLKSSLAIYTNRIDYLRALADGCQRIGLDGNPAGEPTEEQRARARKQLRHLLARQRKADRAGKAAQEAAG
ncbi:TPA: ProQ/FINO family protein [Escherichia coli]